MGSVRRRATWLSILVCLSVVSAGGVVLGWVIGATIREERDRGLAIRLRALAALTDEEDGVIELDYVPGQIPEYSREEAPDHFEFWLDDGSLLYRSSDFEEPLLEEPRACGERVQFLDHPLPDGRDGRVAALRYTPRGDGDVTLRGSVAGEEETGLAGSGASDRQLILAVGTGTAEVEELIADLRLVVWAVVGSCGGMLVLLVWRTLGSAFRPVDRLAEQVAQLGDLDDQAARQIVEASAPRELRPFVEQLQLLLRRLSRVLERERRFSGHVAHELRTPIAELKSLAAVGSEWPDDPEAAKAFFDDVGAVADRMQLLIGDLLLIARCQAGVEPVKVSGFLLRELIEETWAQLYRERARPDVEFEVLGETGLSVVTDAGKLGILLRNLLHNALSHGSPGTAVACELLVSRDAEVCVEIRNRARPLGARAIASLTEPFWSAADEDGGGAVHAGLGLALVGALVDVLELDLAFEQGDDGVFVARVRGLSRDLGAVDRPAESSTRPA